jgi:putative two-component system response regulator
MEERILQNETNETRLETRREVVILVDDNITNLKMGKNALAATYEVYTAPSAVKMFDLIEQYPPDMILLDIDMPVMDGYQAIEILKATPGTAHIPVIFLTGTESLDSETKCLKLGAADFLHKPFVSEVLNMRVELHLEMIRRQRKLLEQEKKLREFNEHLQDMVDKKTENILNLQVSMLQTVADLVERRDGNTGGHVIRTQKYVEILLNEILELGIYADQLDKEWDLELVALSSQLHDVGKIVIPDSILLKNGKLNIDEFNEMKKHTVYGADIIYKMMEFAKDNEFLQHAKVFAETHQEKWDGSGYPKGLAGEDIPLLGRLMAVADVYDALVSVRPYKVPFSHDEAVRIIIEGRGTHFDPVFVDIFESVADKFKEVFETTTTE